MALIVSFDWVDKDAKKRVTGKNRTRVTLAAVHFRNRYTKTTLAFCVMVPQDASQQIEGKFFLFGNDIFYVWNFKMKDSFRCKTNTQGLIANTVNPQCLLGLTISLI